MVVLCFTSFSSYLYLSCLSCPSWDLFPDEPVGLEAGTGRMAGPGSQAEPGSQVGLGRQPGPGTQVGPGRQVGPGTQVVQDNPLAGLGNLQVVQDSLRAARDSFHAVQFVALDNLVVQGSLAGYILKQISYSLFIRKMRPSTRIGSRGVS